MYVLISAQGATIVQGNQTIQGVTQVLNNANIKTRTQENIQPKVTATTRNLSTILPSSSIRPGSSVSTQTTSGMQSVPQVVQKTQVLDLIVG